MGRKKALTERDIFDVTGEILKEEGLQGVHFKKVADRLDVGRSTLYEYFENKDDLLLAYMKRLMDDMNQKVENIPASLPANEKLYKLLLILLEHTQLHQIDRMIRDLQSSDKHAAMFYKEELDVDLMQTYNLMKRWIEAAKEQGAWKQSIDSGLLGDIIFHSILFPNREKMGVESMARQLFEIIEHGMTNHDSSPS